MADELPVTNKSEVAPQGEFTREGRYFSPAVDIFGSDNELILLADMPGVSPDQVEIDLQEEVLTILGRITQEAEEKGQGLMTEYQTGNYFRSFRVTDMIDQTKITASMSDGVLKLVMPKAEKAVPRKIPITSE